MLIETVIGLIMMVVIGPAVGNYATSIVYRLPLGQTPFEKHPYCGDCQTMLTPRDLMPIWSYVLSRGKCRHCGVQIRPSYTVIEVMCGLLFVGNFLAFGISELFILVTAFGVFMVMLGGLEYHQARLYPIILSFCFFIAAMMRLMVDGSIYPMIQSGFICFFAVTAGWQIAKSVRGNRSKLNPEDTGYRVPEAAIFASLAGIALPLKLALIAMAGGLILYALQRIIWGWKMQSAAAGLAIWLSLLAGQHQLIG